MKPSCGVGCEKPSVEWPERRVGGVKPECSDNTALASRHILEYFNEYVIEHVRPTKLHKYTSLRTVSAGCLLGRPIERVMFKHSRSVHRSGHAFRTIAEEVRASRPSVMGPSRSLCRRENRRRRPFGIRGMEQNCASCPVPNRWDGWQ